MKLSEIPGATPHQICEELRRIARLVPSDEAIVEIGVWKGRTACYLAAGAREGLGAHVWAIDPWDLPGRRRTYAEDKAGSVTDAAHFTSPMTREEARRHVDLLGFGDSVTLVQGFSWEVGLHWESPSVGLMFVDGDHHQESVEADFRVWRRHFAQGATIAFDDYEASFDGVVAAVDGLLQSGKIVDLVVLHGRLAVARIA